jgi:hypothetical protein
MAIRSCGPQHFRSLFALRERRNDGPGEEAVLGHTLTWTLPMVVTVQSINRNEDIRTSAACKPVAERRGWPPVVFPTRLEELVNNEEELASYS